jgi:hypothetical protein
MQHPIWREDWSIVYKSSPAQSFSGHSPTGLMTTFYCLRFETSPTWRTRSPYLYLPGTCWPGFSPRDNDLSRSSSLYSLGSDWIESTVCKVPLLFRAYLSLRYVFIEPLRSSGQFSASVIPVFQLSCRNTHTLLMNIVRWLEMSDINRLLPNPRKKKKKIKNIV